MQLIFVGHRSPWELLGVGDDASERDIRSAYARQLKTTRPEDDAAAFQRLVEARDFLMTVARRRAREGGPTTPAHQVATSEELARRRAEAELNELMREAQAAASLPEPLPALDDISETPAAPAEAASEPKSEPALAVPPPPALDAVMGEIVARLDPDVPLAILLEWPKHVAALGTLDLTERMSADRALLRRFPVNIGSISILSGPEPRRGLLSFLGYAKSDTRKDDRERARIQASMLAALDQEFGWTAYDRHVYDVLEPADAQRVLTALGGFARAAELQLDGKPPAYDGYGLPILDVRDVMAFFGADYRRYADLYARSRQAGRWALDRDWWGALYAPFHILKFGLWELAAAWIAAAIWAVLLINSTWPVFAGLRRLVELVALRAVGRCAGTDPCRPRLLWGPRIFPALYAAAPARLGPGPAGAVLAGRAHDASRTRLGPTWRESLRMEQHLGLGVRCDRAYPPAHIALRPVGDCDAAKFHSGAAAKSAQFVEHVSGAVPIAKSHPRPAPQGHHRSGPEG